MDFENKEFGQKKFETGNSEQEKGTTPKRLLLALEANLKFVTGEINVEGIEHIKEIPPDKKVIIVTTHLSDLDVPIAALKLGKYFNIAITSESLHHSFRGEAGVNIGLRIAGKENFIPIEYKKVKGGKQGAFNPENFKPIKDALNSGKAVVIAGHNPTQKWQLPKGGYGAAYLADITENAILLPVTVNLESEEPIGMAETLVKNIAKRPDANINIGAPMEIKKIIGIGDLADIMNKRDHGETLTHQERKRFSELKKALEVQSDAIMEKLASPLPEKKKGAYAVK